VRLLTPLQFVLVYNVRTVHANLLPTFASATALRVVPNFCF
jgi:hypothetical protein